MCKMIEFSKTWKSSSKPKKQRKYIANLPMHLRKKRLSAHLSKELQEKYKKRNITLRKGDKVKIVRGQFKGKTGAVTVVNTKLGRIFVDGIDRNKIDGSKSFFKIHPSNVIITSMNTEDKKRIKSKEK